MLHKFQRNSTAKALEIELYQIFISKKKIIPNCTQLITNRNEILKHNSLDEILNEYCSLPENSIRWMKI